MNVGACTQPLGGTQKLSRPGGTSDLADQIKDLEKRLLEEVVKAAQIHGPKVAMQLAQQAGGAAAGDKASDAGLSGVDDAKAGGSGSTKRHLDEMEKLLADIRRKQEAAAATDGAQGASAQGQQQYRMAQDVYVSAASNRLQAYAS